MGKRIFFQLLSFIVLIAAITESCHTNSQPSGRRKRSTDTTSEFMRIKIKSCLAQSVSRMNSSVDFFVLHSQWFENTVTSCPSDEAQCWIEELKNIIPSYETLYDDISGGGPYKRRKRSLKSKRYVDNSNQVNCPDVSGSEFQQVIETNNLKTVLVTDTTFTQFEDLAYVMQTYVVCPLCTCEVLANESQPKKFDATGCENCWYTKLAAAIKPSSPLLEPITEIVFEFIEATSITCVPQTRIILDAGTLNEMGIDNIEEEAYLGKLKSCFDEGKTDPVLECRAANVTSLLDEQIAYFDISSEKCIDPEDIKVENNELVLKYYVMKLPKLDLASKVQRYTCSVKEFTCRIPMIQQRSLIPIDLQGRPDLLLDDVISNMSTSFSFTLKNRSSIVLGNDIEIEIEHNSSSPESYRLTVGRCWATPTDTRVYADPKYDITDCFGCPLDTSGTTQVINNGAAKVEVKFQSFVWANPLDQSIYFNCEITLCYKLVENCTTPQDCSATLPNSCPSRSRRSFSNTEAKIFSSKPIRLSSKDINLQEEQKTQKCSSNNGGCEELCTEVSSVNGSTVQCGCKPNQYLDIDGVSCKSVSKEPSTKETFSGPTDF